MKFGSELGFRVQAYRVTSLIRNAPPPWGHLKALHMELLWGPTGWVFLMSEVPLYAQHSSNRGPAAHGVQPAGSHDFVSVATGVPRP